MHQNCSNLLELAAADDLAAFVYEVEENGYGYAIDDVSFWYGRSFGMKKMSYEERTPLMIAALYGSTEVLKYIIGTGDADVNRGSASDGATALHCAAAGGSWSSIEVVKMLIDASGDISVVDSQGRRPADLIAPCVKSSTGSRRKTLEMLLNGIGELDLVEEGIKTAETVTEKKEYPIDVPLPDINNGLYGTDEFRMYSFKVNPCSRAYSHDWTECPFVHPGENARRRDPRKFNYSCVPCPEFKKGSCGKSDACEYAHGVFESWLHPAQYRTRLCKDETNCSRKVCFFAHKSEELRPLCALTGSAMPSPKSISVSSMDLTPVSLGSPGAAMSPSVSSPMNGSLWQSKLNRTPPVLQLPGSRLKASLSARDLEVDMELLGLEQIRTQQQQQQQRQQLIEDLANLSFSPYGRIGDLKPTNLDNVFASMDSPLLSHQLRSSYPSTMSSSSARKQPYGFDSSAAAAAAVMNSRSSAFAKRSQSFVGRSGGAYRPGQAVSGSANAPSLMPKISEWSSPDGKLDWGFKEDDVSKLRKSASFGFRNVGGGSTARISSGEPDVSWVNSLVRDVPSGMYGGDAIPHWIDQMYIEQEQMVA